VFKEWKVGGEYKMGPREEDLVSEENFVAYRVFSVDLKLLERKKDGYDVEFVG
jgi:hypothetical protein